MGVSAASVVGFGSGLKLQFSVGDDLFGRKVVRDCELSNNQQTTKQQLLLQAAAFFESARQWRGGGGGDSRNLES